MEQKSQQSDNGSVGGDSGMYKMELPDEDDIKNNAFLLSTTMSVGDKSFIDSRQPYKRLAPPPKYFDNEFLHS